MDAAAIGVPDEKLGEMVACVVWLAESLKLKISKQGYCRAEAEFRRPSQGRRIATKRQEPATLLCHALHCRRAGLAK